MPATSMPNGGPSAQHLEGLYILICTILSGLDPQLLQEFRKFASQNEYIQQKYNPRSNAQPTQSYEEILKEVQATQKWIDRAFEYVAPSLLVTSVLASGELVGSTIWGIAKYVSKDVIYDTLGATTAAVILQSADLIGYKNDVQQLFGIKNSGRRATLAIKIGGMAGKAIGAVAGSALSVYAELAVGGMAPALIPWVVGTGFFAGQIIGEVAGAGLGAGLNNLFFSTIGMVPASYKGIKQKGGKFADRIKNSRAEKRKAKEAKAAPKVKKEAEENAVPVKKQGAGAPKGLPAQLLLEGGEPAQQPNPNAALVLAKVPFVQGKSGNGNQQKGKGTYTPLVIGQRGNNEQNVVVPPVHAITGEGGNKTVVENPGVQQAADQNVPKKKSRKKTSRSKKQDTTSVNNSGKNKTAVQTKVKKTVTPLSQPIAPKNQDVTLKNITTKRNVQYFDATLKAAVTEEGGEWQKVPTEKELNAAKQQKKQGQALHRLQSNSKAENLQKKNKTQSNSKTFTQNIQPQNALKNALTQGEQNKGQLHAGKSRNRSDQNSQSSGMGRNK